MHANPIESYNSMSKQSMSARELEASVLTKAGLMLKRCQENWTATDRDEKLQEAIKFNQTVWSFFQAELSKDDNPLPLQIRQDVLNLSLFIDRRLFEVLAFPDPDKLTSVIDINLNLAAGLRTTTE